VRVSGVPAGPFKARLVNIGVLALRHELREDVVPRLAGWSKVAYYDG